MKKLAIIGAKEMACYFAINARKMGVETHCFAWGKDASAKDEVDFFYDISIFEKEKIRDICKEIAIDGVVATTELTISIAAFIAQSLGLNGNPLLVAEEITDKYRNRCRLMEHPVPFLHQPFFLVADSAEDIKASSLKYPMILKPVGKGGKRGISVVYSEGKLEDAYKYCQEDCGGNTKVIAEEYIEEGQEYSVETLSYKGKHTLVQITEKTSSGPPHCVELGHYQPAPLSAQMRKCVNDAVCGLLTVVGMENGPCHTELKIKDGLIFLIELNARPGGDFISYPLTELSTGYPFLQGAVRIALNQEPMVNKLELQSNPAGVIFLSNQTEQFRTLFEQSFDPEWMYERKIEEQGNKEFYHNQDYCGYLIFTHKTKEEVLSLLHTEGN